MATSSEQRREAYEIGLRLVGKYLALLAIFGE